MMQEIFTCDSVPAILQLSKEDELLQATYQQAVTWLSRRVVERESDLIFISKQLTKWADSRLGCDSETIKDASPRHGYQWTFEHKKHKWRYCVHSNRDPQNFQAELHHADHIKTFSDYLIETIGNIPPGQHCQIL